MDVNKILQDFLKTLPKQKQKEFLQEFQELSPEEQQEFLGTLAQQMEQPQIQTQQASTMKKGGKVKSDAGFLEDYLSKMTEEEQDLIISQLEAMSPQDRTNSIQYMKCGGKLQMGGQTHLPVEVEGGETLYTPDQELQKFEGPKHSEGGIDVNLPEGSKIFSEHLKVPNEIYETVFNKTTKGKKKSFADLSKKFPTEPHQKVLEDPNADDYAKQTALYSLERNKANLNLLFEAQEGMKASKEMGMMMQLGGKIKYQSGGFYPEGLAKISTEELIGKYNSGLELGVDDQTIKQEIERRQKAQRAQAVFNQQAFGTGVNPVYDQTSKAPLNLFDMTVNRQGQTVKGDQSISPGTPLIDSYGQPDLLPTGQFQVLDVGLPRGASEEKVPTVVTPKKGKAKTETPVVPAPEKPNFPVPQPRSGEDAPAPVLVDPFNVPKAPNLSFDPVVSQRAAPSINLTINEQEEKKKKKRYYGIDDKLAGTALDIMSVLSDNIKIDGPQYRDNRKYPLFSRYVDFEDKTAAKMLDKSIQQIQNSNMPSQVKQSMIANAQAQFADQQGQHDMQNAQRYENKIQQDTNKLQSYLDSNIDQATQDIDVYRQKKAQVDYLRDQFKAKRKEQIVNSARNYFDYTSKVNKMNQLYSDNYDYNPITGRVVFEGSKQDPLKQQEQLIAQYAKSGQNQVSLPNGASLTILNDTVGILTDRDGKTQYVDLSKGQGRQQPQSGQNPWGL